MPLKKSIKYSSDPEHRVKNKDGTVKRFPYELFPGDVVVQRYGWGTNKQHEVEALVGNNRVKLKDTTNLGYVSSLKVLRKAY